MNNVKQVTLGTVIIRWWQDQSGYYGVNDNLNYSAGGATYEDLRQRVAESAKCENWNAWALVSRR